MKVMITGGAGFLGQRLARKLLERGMLQGPGGRDQAQEQLLLNDYSRRGFVDGRVLRLPTVSVRPGRPNKAASSFASGIIREPLNGEDAVCPVAPDTRLWLLSPREAIECLIAGHDIPAAVLGTNRAINLPGISVTVSERLAALEQVAGAAPVRPAARSPTGRSPIASTRPAQRPLRAQPPGSRLTRPAPGHRQPMSRSARAGSSLLQKLTTPGAARPCSRSPSVRRRTSWRDTAGPVSRT